MTLYYFSDRFSNGLDDSLKFILEGSTTDEESIYVWLLDELTTVSTIDRATVQDSSFTSDFFGNILSKPCSDLKVSLLSLLWSCDLAGTNGPNWLISNDDVTPMSFI